MSEEAAAATSSALVLALDTLRQMPFSPTDAGLPQKDMKAFIEALPANLKERLKSSTRRLLPEDLWTLPVSMHPQVRARARVRVRVRVRSTNPRALTLEP